MHGKRKSIPTIYSPYSSESFRDICMDYYELDPAHYFTTPNFAWDCMLKKTGVKLELLTDYDMHLMFEHGHRVKIVII